MNPTARTTETAEQAPLRRTRITTLTAANVSAIGWTVVGLVVVVRAIVTASGDFYWDDFILQGRAARMPLNLEFLLHSHDGHVMPMVALISWLSERIAPLGYWLPVTTMIVLQAGAAVGSWLLLRRVFGTRPLVLLPLLIVLFCAMTLPGAVWWSASLNALPMQLGMLGVTWGAWLMCRDGRERAGRWWVLGSIVGSLLFFEKSLLLGLWLVCVVWLFEDQSNPVRWIQHQWRIRRWFWALLLVLALGYLALYFSVSNRSAGIPQTFGGLLTALATGVFVAILPSLIGGPGSWEPIGWGAALADPNIMLIVLAAGAVLALIVFATRQSPRGVRAWIAAGIYLLAVVGLMATTRLAGANSSFGMAGMRYTADTLVPLVLAIGMSVMPVVGDRESARMSDLRQGLAARPKFVAGSALAVLCASAMVATVSVISFWGIWSSIPAGPWLDNARSTMAAGANDGPILEQAVPEYVLAGLAFPYSNASWALAPLPKQPGFADYTNNPRFIRDNGRLVAGEVVGIESAPGPDGFCGTALKPGITTVPLVGPTFDWEHQLQLDYTALTDAPAIVQLGTGRTVPVTFIAGTHRMVVRVEGGGSTFTIEDLPASAGVCMPRAVVGGWRALPQSGSAAP